MLTPSQKGALIGPLRAELEPPAKAPKDGSGPGDKGLNMSVSADLLTNSSREHALRSAYYATVAGALAPKILHELFLRLKKRLPASLVACRIKPRLEVK